MRVLAFIYPVDVCGTVGRCGVLIQGAEEVEGGEDEECEGGALGVVGGVLSREVGFEAAEPVFYVFGFVECWLQG